MNLCLRKIYVNRLRSEYKDIKTLVGTYPLHRTRSHRTPRGDNLQVAQNANAILSQNLNDIPLNLEAKTFYKKFDWRLGKFKAESIKIEIFLLKIMPKSIFYLIRVTFFVSSP